MRQNTRREEYFNDLYDAYAKGIYRLALHYTRDKDMAHDILQGTFMKLYKHLDNINLDTVYPWLCRVAKNLAYDYSQAAKNEILGEVFDFIIESTNALPSMEECYLKKQQVRDKKELCDSILERLSLDHKNWFEALVLVYCLDKPQMEVAEELGISLETLHSRLYRARQWVYKHYEEEYKKVEHWF